MATWKRGSSWTWGLTTLCFRARGSKGSPRKPFWAPRSRVRCGSGLRPTAAGGVDTWSPTRSISRPDLTAWPPLPLRTSASGDHSVALIAPTSAEVAGHVHDEVGLAGRHGEGRLGMPVAEDRHDGAVGARLPGQEVERGGVAERARDRGPDVTRGARLDDRDVGHHRLGVGGNAAAAGDGQVPHPAGRQPPPPERP